MNRVKSLRIATWNLNKPTPGSWQRLPRIQEQIAKIDADIWVFTETNNRAIDLSNKYNIASSKPLSDGSNYTTIYAKSSIPIQAEIVTFDPEAAVCICLELSVGLLLIYGTIITYHNDKGIDGNSKQWEEHYKSIQAHGDDWKKILTEYPNCGFCVAGDFNQSRDGSNWYGTKLGRDLLTGQLTQNELVCLTEENMKDTGKLKLRHNIDHICLSKNWLGNRLKETQVQAWEGFTEDGINMTDHNGISIDLYFQSSFHNFRNAFKP